MIKGRNHFIFNQATMQAAVEHYLQEVLMRPAVQFSVEGVKPLKGEGNSDCFEIEVMHDMRAEADPNDR